MSCNHNDSGDLDCDQENSRYENNITNRIIKEVAAYEQVDPTTVDPPLYTVIDAEALESLFAKTDSDLEVTFQWSDYTVVVDHEIVFVEEEE